MLAGEGQYVRPQQLNFDPAVFDPAVYEQVNVAAKKAWDKLHRGRLRIYLKLVLGLKEECVTMPGLVAP
ncbi:rCG54555 [Rattus norvegicus]|uniref:RCG54555 n=1 Tax=Rattus norvegicus TaxID=10116 RepID=A6JAC5_RAT|nr:rCG54555 [Rattus norvegicus]